MPNLTNSYETVIILSNNLGDEAIAATIEKFKKLIADNGEVESVEDWGNRKFAYPIQKQNEGHYTLKIDVKPAKAKKAPKQFEAAKAE